MEIGKIMFGYISDSFDSTRSGSSPDSFENFLRPRERFTFGSRVQMVAWRYYNI